LQRLSTNDLQTLAPNSYLRTALANPLGRLVDLLTLLPMDGALLALSTMRTAAETRHWLEKFIFFQDDVSVHVDGEFSSQWSIIGPQAHELASRVFPELAPPMPGGLDEFPGGVALGIREPGGGGLLLLLREESTRSAEVAWGDAALQSRAEEVYQVMRIEAGIPEPGAELTQEVIPLEAGLWNAVSFSKGCYIGQEILARMESRGKLARRLRGILLDGQAEPGDAIRSEGTHVGTVTSAALSPRLGWIALGMVRGSLTGGEEPSLLIGPHSLRARLTDLPFSAG
jgi:aminomethyltransferase